MKYRYFVMYGFVLVFTLVIQVTVALYGDVKYVKEYANLPPVNFSLADAVKSDVQYRLFTHKEDDEGLVVNDETIKDVKINTSLPTKLFIHGWTTNERSPWYDPLRKEYYAKGPHNVIYIDWSKAGNKSFPVSAANVDPVGKFIAEFLTASKVSLDKVHVIGHSLGSQLAGFIGKHVFKMTGTKIGRITAPDPCGPMFEHEQMSPEQKLDKTDANFVDVIHTDIGHYGYIAPIGHVDYYVNGGRNQPGCPPLEEDDNCSHARSIAYFIESVNSLDFVAKKCKTWDDFVNGNCDKKDDIIFGENVSSEARGVYFFATNSSPPYAKK